MKWILILIIGVMIISLVSASGLTLSPSGVSSTSVHLVSSTPTVNANNSLYWQGHTGTDGSWLTGIASGNPFDQDLNTTDNVTFEDILGGVFKTSHTAQVNNWTERFPIIQAEVPYGDSVNYGSKMVMGQGRWNKGTWYESNGIVDFSFYRQISAGGVWTYQITPLSIREDGRVILDSVYKLVSSGDEYANVNGAGDTPSGTFYVSRPITSGKKYASTFGIKMGTYDKTVTGSKTLTEFWLEEGNGATGTTVDTKVMDMQSDGNITIYGNLNVTKNIFVGGCIQYNMSGIPATLGTCI